MGTNQRSERDGKESTKTHQRNKKNNTWRRRLMVTVDWIENPVFSPTVSLLSQNSQTSQRASLGFSLFSVCLCFSALTSQLFFVLIRNLRKISPFFLSEIYVKVNPLSFDTHAKEREKICKLNRGGGMQGRNAEKQKQNKSKRKAKNKNLICWIDYQKKKNY